MFRCPFPDALRCVPGQSLRPGKRPCGGAERDRGWVVTAEGWRRSWENHSVRSKQKRKAPERSVALEQSHRLEEKEATNPTRMAHDCTGLWWPHVPTCTWNIYNQVKWEVQSLSCTSPVLRAQEPHAASAATPDGTDIGHRCHTARLLTALVQAEGRGHVRFPSPKGSQGQTRSPQAVLFSKPFPL